jgi:hypothetical protein
MAAVHQPPQHAPLKSQAHGTDRLRDVHRVGVEDRSEVTGLVLVGCQ